jgi:hypothetical protein
MRMNRGDVVRVDYPFTAGGGKVFHCERGGWRLRSRVIHEQCEPGSALMSDQPGGHSGNGQRPPDKRRGGAGPRRRSNASARSQEFRHPRNSDTHKLVGIQTPRNSDTHKLVGRSNRNSDTHKLVGRSNRPAEFRHPGIQTPINSSVGAIGQGVRARRLVAVRDRVH